MKRKGVSCTNYTISTKKHQNISSLFQLFSTTILIQHVRFNPEIKSFVMFLFTYITYVSKTVDLSSNHNVPILSLSGFNNLIDIKMYHVRVLFLVFVLVTNGKGWLNSYDGLLDFTCPKNQAVSGIRSQHDNGAEDRVFDINCRATIGAADHCQWSGEQLCQISVDFR